MHYVNLDSKEAETFYLMCTVNIANTLNAVDLNRGECKLVLTVLLDILTDFDPNAKDHNLEKFKAFFNKRIKERIAQFKGEILKR